MRPQSLRDSLINAADRVLGYPQDAIHFLHVPKTAGSQIKLVARQVNQRRVRNRIRAHEHEIRLLDLPKDQRYFFSTRDPISRFRSAFHWRVTKRGNQPEARWNSGETLAFQHFASANTLAEALFLPDRRGIDAALAMKTIRHTSRNLVDTFTLHGFDLFQRPPIWIIRMENLQDDLAEFLRRIGYTGPFEALGEDPAARRQSYDGAPPLSDLAKQNLRRWYAQDFEFLRGCDAWLEANGASGGQGKAAN
ncbi:Sulfotransferase [Paracoccaceae bacterium]|jgi:hypothetical protein